MRSLLVVVLLFSCGRTPADVDASEGAVDAGAAVNTAPVRCWPTDTNTSYRLSCSPQSELCVNDYAGLSSFPKPNSCQPLVPACVTDRTCECVLAHFHCGNSTTCSVSPTGVLRVVCRPD